MLSGAAPLPIHVEEFLRVTSGAPLTQGYGMVEWLFVLVLSQSCLVYFSIIIKLFTGNFVYS